MLEAVHNLSAKCIPRRICYDKTIQVMPHFVSGGYSVATNIYLFITVWGCKLAVNLQRGGEVIARSLFLDQAHDLNSCRRGPLEIEAERGFVVGAMQLYITPSTNYND
ncbi:unnamed protein product [Colias eurytheme]|nr:unnamed protein product [Colias eurytheme]